MIKKGVSTMEVITVAITGTGAQKTALEVMRAVNKTLARCNEDCRVQLRNEKVQSEYEEVEVVDFVQRPAVKRMRNTLPRIGNGRY